MGWSPISLRYEPMHNLQVRLDVGPVCAYVCPQLQDGGLTRGAPARHVPSISDRDPLEATPVTTTTAFALHC